MSLETFLDDLDDLDDGEGADARDDEVDDEDDDSDLDMMGDEQGAGAPSVSGLLHSAAMVELMGRVDARMAQDASGDDDTDESYGLIVSCNEMVIEVDNETEAIAKTIKDEYARRFPELDSLILNPLDFPV